MTDPFNEKSLDDDSPLNLSKLSGLPVVGPMLGKFFKGGPKIPVIRLSGVIADARTQGGGVSYARMSNLTDPAYSTAKAPVVVLGIDSPCGAP